MSPRLRFWTFAFLASALAACSDDDDSPPPAPTEPPALEIVALLTSDGTRLRSYAPGSPVGEPCDGQLTVRVGPADGAGRLIDWELRPPGTCGRIVNCGYVQVRLSDSSGEELATGSAASTRVLLNAGELSPTSEYRVTALLRQGTTGEVVTVLDETTGETSPIEAEANFTVEAQSCPEPAPGGTGGTTGEDGVGGMGGASG